MPDVATIQTSIQQATVEVTEVDQVQIVEVSVSGSPVIVETGIVGPQGPPGASGAAATSLSSLNDVNVVNKVNKSVLVYDQITDKFVANDANTISTITDGGNF